MGDFWTTINFFDFVIIDPDTVAFLLGIYPELSYFLLVGTAIGIPLLMSVWRIHAIPRCRAP